MEDQSGKKKVLEKFIDNIFSMEMAHFYLILIFFLGFFLRLIAAINLSVAADDMHFVTHAINFLSADRLITYDQSSGLWFAFTSFIFNIFGMTQLTSRFAPLLFGSFSILAIYFLANEFFSKRVSLLAAFLLAIAPFHIKNTVAEMDVMAMFFSLVAIFLFVKATKSDNLRFFAFSGIFFGLAIYTKVYPLLFIPSLLLYFIYAGRKSQVKALSKNNVKKIFLFLFLIFLFTIPALTHNYLLYKDKGFLDLQFTRTLGLGKDISEQYYGWDAQFNTKNSWKGLFFGDTHHVASGTPLLLAAINYILFGDPIVFFFGLFGIFLIFYKKKNKNYLMFSFFCILFVLPFLASIILLPKHYIFLEMLLIPLASLSINEIEKKSSLFFKTNTMKYFAIILLIFTLVFLGFPNKSNIEHFYGKSHVAQMIDFKNGNIPENALIVGDSRIYRGRMHWAFQERPYLEAADFISVIQNQDELPGNLIFVDVYFFECIPDDCGWGTIKNQPEFNATMESLVSTFSQNGALLKKISEPIEEKPYYPLISKEKFNVINIYYSKIQMKSSIMDLATHPKKWFLYDIGFIPTENQFDYYETSNAFDNLLNKIAQWMVLLSLILSFLAPLFIIYLLFSR